MTETRAQQRYSITTKKSLSRQTSYNGKKKERDPLGLGPHIMVSEPRFVNT